MEQLHAEVAKLQAIGMRFLDIKQEVGLLLQQSLVQMHTTSWVQLAIRSLCYPAIADRTCGGGTEGQPGSVG